MTTTRTKPVIILAILLAVLALVSVTSLVTTQLGGFLGANRIRGNFNGTPGPNGNFQQGGNNNGGGNFQGGNGGNGGGVQGNNNNGRGNAGGFQGGNGGGGNFQGRGGGGFGGGAFAIFGAARSIGINPQAFFFVGLGVSIIGIVLALLCAFGVWKQKKAALNWAMVLAILFLLSALPGFFFGGRFNIIRMVMDGLTLAASVAIIVMSVLPSVRENFE